MNMLEGYANDETLRNLASEVNDFWCCGGSIDTIDAPQSMQDVVFFIREYVSTRRPCIIRNAFPNHDNDGRSHIRNILTLDDIHNYNNNKNNKNDCTIVVDVTPDGYGDCIRRVKDAKSMDCNKKMFVKPMQVSMTISQFTKSLRNGRNKQRQQFSSNQYDPIEHTIIPIMEQQNMTSNTKDYYYDDDDDDDAVLYYSRQNDCLRKELQELIPKSTY